MVLTLRVTKNDNMDQGKRQARNASTFVQDVDEEKQQRQQAASTRNYEYESDQMKALREERLRGEARQVREEAGRLEERQARNRGEIYNLFSLYMLFQGIIISAVFAAGPAASERTCRVWWVPFTLGLIASVSLAWAILDRTLDAARTASNLHAALRSLQAIESASGGGAPTTLLGVSFEVQPPATPPQTPTTVDQDVRLNGLCGGLLANVAWRDCVLSYIWGTLILSTIFSAIVLASCRLVLCD